MILLLWYFENKNEQICFTLKSAWCTCAVTTFQKPYGRFLALHMAMLPRAQICIPAIDYTAFSQIRDINVYIQIVLYRSTAG